MKRGRPKGLNSYIEMTYEELSDYVGKKTVVKVSRKWFDFLKGEEVNSLDKEEIKEENEEDKKYPPIAYTVTNFNDE